MKRKNLAAIVGTILSAGAGLWVGCRPDSNQGPPKPEVRVQAETRDEFRLPESVVFGGDRYNFDKEDLSRYNGSMLGDALDMALSAAKGKEIMSGSYDYTINTPDRIASNDFPVKVIRFSSEGEAVEAFDRIADKFEKGKFEVNYNGKKVSAIKPTNFSYLFIPSIDKEKNIIRITGSNVGFYNEMKNANSMPGAGPFGRFELDISRIGGYIVYTGAEGPTNGKLDGFLRNLHSGPTTQPGNLDSYMKTIYRNYPQSQPSH